MPPCRLLRKFQRRGTSLGCRRLLSRPCRQHSAHQAPLCGMLRFRQQWFGRGRLAPRKECGFLQGDGSSQLLAGVDPFAPAQRGQGTTTQSSGRPAAPSGSSAPAGRELIVFLGRPGGRRWNRIHPVKAGGGLAPAVHHGHGGATAGRGGAVCRPAAGALSSHSGLGQRAECRSAV